MSAYENVVGGKLRLKGKALDVKAGGVKKKNKKGKRHHDDDNEIGKHDILEDESASNADYSAEDLNEAADKLADKGRPPSYDDRLTPAERRYIEQKENIDKQRLAKTSNKSHRDRIQDFNQYLANMSEHYDIPKVGPG